MRNLKKILAMVLALIMSLSLMATAGATDFSDDADISESYKVAAEVLNGLGVFQGYDGGARFEPKGEISRAEVAAIIYRIATGDVNDTQTSIYSSWGMFDDVKDGQWFAGYVNYCANAGYVKGRNDGLFWPNDKVTGYEAIIMILRAVGYDKMGEFSGNDWRIMSASTARERGILKNVTTGELGQAATREMVAEILFRAILINKVDYTPAFGYQIGNTTIGYESLDLEEVTGVVVANEWADLYSSVVMEEGKTNLEVTPGDIRTLDYSSELTDIGESRLAYIQNNKVLSMDDKDQDGNPLNTVFQGGAAVNIASRTAFKQVSGLNETENTEYYVDFGTPDGHYGCDYRIEFNVTFYTSDAEALFDRKYVDISAVSETDADLSDSWNGGAGNYATGRTYHKVIFANEVITEDDLAIIHGIFASADDSAFAAVNNQAQNRLEGDVYVGTKSTPDITGDRDISNDMSYRQFVAEYIMDSANVETWDDSANGEWVKIIDNDGDGNADYAFKTNFWLDTVVGSYTRDDVTTWEYRGLNTDMWQTRYVENYSPAAKDVVIYTLIDGMANIHKADMKTDVVNTINFRDNTITVNTGDEAGKVWGQSGITNWTGMDQIITTMEELVSYNMYRDEFGYVRAFELADGHEYGLLTEIYSGRVNAGQVVTGNSYSVEITSGDPETQESQSGQYTLGSGATFVAANNLDLTPNNPNNVAASNSWVNYRNVLQRATAHLGANITYTGTSMHPAIPSTSMTLGVANGDEFNYGTANLGDVDRYGDYTYTYTNVARYTINENDVANLRTVVEYAEDQNGSQVYYDTDPAAWHNWDNDVNNIRNTGDKCTEAQWIAGHMTANGSTQAQAKAAFDAALERTLFRVYDTDYVPLAAGNITARQRSWNTSWNESYAYPANNAFINAVYDTEFYVLDISTGTVDYFTSWENVPAIGADHIRSVYAVAENTTADRNAEDYWVANVIVIELYEYPEGAANWQNVALVYYNPSQTTGDVRSLDALYTGSTSTPEATLIPAGYSWGREWLTAGYNYGFYATYGDSVDTDGKTVKADITPITRNWSDYGIHVGVISRMNELTERGGYIVVDEYAGMRQINGQWVATTGSSTPVANAPVYAINGNVAMPLRMTSNPNTSNVEVGDVIIWVTGKDSTVDFIIDVTTPTVRNNNGRAAVSYAADVWATPSWLYSEGEESTLGMVPHTTNSIVGRILSSQRVVPVVAPFSFYGSNALDRSSISVTTGDIATANGALTSVLSGKTYVGSVSVTYATAKDATAYWVAPNTSYSIYKLNSTTWTANSYPGIPDGDNGAYYLVVVGDNYYILYQAPEGSVRATLASRDPSKVSVYTAGNDTKVVIFDTSMTLSQLQSYLYNTNQYGPAVVVRGTNADGVTGANMASTINGLLASGGNISITVGSTTVTTNGGKITVADTAVWFAVGFNANQVTVYNDTEGEYLVPGQYVYSGSKLIITLGENVVVDSYSGTAASGAIIPGTIGNGVKEYTISSIAANVTIVTHLMNAQDTCNAAAATLTGRTINVTIPYSVGSDTNVTNAAYDAAVETAVNDQIVALLRENGFEGYTAHITGWTGSNPSANRATPGVSKTATATKIEIVSNSNTGIKADAFGGSSVTVTINVNVAASGNLETALSTAAGVVNVNLPYGQIASTVTATVRAANVPGVTFFECTSVTYNGTVSGVNLGTMICNYTWIDNAGVAHNVTGAEIPVTVRNS